MLKIKAFGSPALSTKGQFRIPMDEFAVIKRDVVNKPVTGVAAAGTNVINMTDTDGFAVGQTVTIVGGGNSEDLIVTVVTPGVSLTTATNMASTYTGVAATVTVKDITHPITGTATGGADVIPMTNTTGMQAGQVIVIEDSAGAETGVVLAVVANTQITVTVNLVNTYTVARGGRVTVVNGNPAQASVQMQKPFAAAAGNAEWIDCSFDAGVNTIVATVQKADAGAGPALPIAWAVAVTADVAGLSFVAIADGE